VAAGRIVVPKSVTPERIASNKDTVELDADDLKVLDDFVADINERKAFQRFVYPEFGVNFGFPDKS
jgi:glycerol 2-dehydrogenase (NADP+)